MRPDCPRADATRPLDCRALLQHGRQSGERRELRTKETAAKPAAREVHRCRRGVQKVAWQRANQERPRRVLDVNPLEVSLPLKHRPRAHPTERRAAMMANDGIGQISATISE